MRKIRVLLADDHTVMRSGLRALLERQDNLEIVGEVENGRDAVSLSGTLLPDLVIMDVGMPLLNGIEATKSLLKQSPSSGVIMLSMHSDEAYVMRSLRAGARAYLLKDSAPSDLLSAIDAVSHGRSYFSSSIRHLLEEDYIRVLRQKGEVDSYELLTT